MVNEAKNLGDAVVDRKTEQGFTPGPWRQGESASQAWAIFGTDDPVAIAEIVSFPVRRENQARANARLIAAAPALYEALQVTERYIKTGCVSAISGVAALQKARAALALVDKPATGSAKRPISDETS